MFCKLVCFLCSLIGAWILLRFRLGPLCITKQCGLGGCRLGLADCCWCHLLITSVAKKCETSRMAPGFDPFPALSGGKNTLKAFFPRHYIIFTGRQLLKGFELHHRDILPNHILAFQLRSRYLLPPLSLLFTKPVL